MRLGFGGFESLQNFAPSFPKPKTMSTAALKRSLRGTLGGILKVILNGILEVLLTGTLKKETLSESSTEFSENSQVLADEVAAPFREEIRKVSAAFSWAPPNPKP